MAKRRRRLRPQPIDYLEGKWFFAEPDYSLPEGRDVYVRTSKVARTLNLTVFDLYNCMEPNAWYRVQYNAWACWSSHDWIWIRSFDTFTPDFKPVRVLDAM
jgi:hypothetical protein